MPIVWLFAQEPVVSTPQEEAVTELVTSLMILLLVATAVALVTRRLRIPFI